MIKLPVLKLLAITVIISGCANSQYTEIYQSLKQTAFSKDLPITQEFFDDQPFSFAKLRIGRSTPIIMVLWQVNNGHYYWVTQSGAEIITLGGKIVEVTGMEHDFQIKQNKKIKFLTQGVSESYGLINFFNPLATSLKIKTTTRLEDSIEIFRLGSNVKAKLFSEHQVVDAIKFTSENSYYIDSSSQVIKAIQTTHPFEPEITIEFYYK
jgi:hypothetical protein